MALDMQELQKLSPQELQERVKQMSPEEIRELQKARCIFCQIIDGKVPSRKIDENEQTISLLDIHPANLGHVLVLPKEHYGILPEMPNELIGMLGITTKHIAGKLKSALQLDSLTVLLANGAGAGQKAPHVMVHVIPRGAEDNLSSVLNPQEKTLSDEQIEELRSKLGLYPEPAQEQAPPSPPVQEPAQEESVLASAQDVSEQVAEQKREEPHAANTEDAKEFEEDKDIDLDKISNLFGA